MSRIAPPVFLVAALTLALAHPLAALDFAPALRAALTAHEEAEDFGEEVRALEALRSLAAEHPDEWLGLFWTAYLETQVARLVLMDQGEGDPGELLDAAQRRLERAEELLGPAGTARERSSLRALQSLIYQFRGWLGGEGPETEGFAERAAEERSRAIRLDPENPVVEVMEGTRLIGQGAQEGDPGQVLAGRALLVRAEAKFAEVEDRSRTTYFNSEWLPFWLPRAEQALEGGDGG